MRKAWLKYRANFESDFNNISDEDAAFSYLLGLSPKPFSDFCAVFKTAQRNDKVIPEKKRPYMKDYSDFLNEHFALGMPARDYVHFVYVSAKEKKLWNGDFKQYTVPRQHKLDR